MKKIALVIGHNDKAQGAVRVTDRRTEYDWNSQLALAIFSCAPPVFRVFRRTAGPNEIGRAYAQISGREFAASIELHFNSHSDPKATGTETLTSGTSGSLRLAKPLQAAMVATLELRDRGLLLRPKGGKENGTAALWAGAPPAVLIEPYFGSNPQDCARADAKMTALARAITGVCYQYLKGEEAHA